MDHERRAYETELDVCFIVRMPRHMRDQIEAHRVWMQDHYKREHVSLASAARDLFHRGLILSPPEQRTVKRRRQARQLTLFTEPTKERTTRRARAAF